MLIKPCGFCGKEFDATPKGRASNPPKQFCSRTCNNHSRGRKVAPDHAFFQRPCEICKQIFDATPSRPAYDPPNRFCAKCFFKGRGLPQRKQVQKICEQCGKGFEVPRSWAERRTGKHATRFCSRPCAWESQKKPRGFPHNKRTEGTMVNRDGYIMRYMPNHPTILARTAAGKKPRRYVMEHRLVMEKVLGRVLLKNETPHHKNLHRADNRPDNLELWYKPQPSGARVSDLIAYCVQYHRPAVLSLLHEST